MVKKALKMTLNVFRRYENNYKSGCVCELCDQAIKVGMSYFPFGKQRSHETFDYPKIKCYRCGVKRAA